MEKPIEKYLGMKCVSCRHFSHKDFNDLESRLKYGRKKHLAFTFGRCEVLDADDAIGSNLVKHESKNVLCHFVSAGDI